MKVLEVNIDDLYYGGVYALMSRIIAKMPDDIQIDIAALEPFERQDHIDFLKKYGCDVYYVGSDTNKIVKQLYIYNAVNTLIKKNQYDVVHLHSDVAHKILVSGLAAKACGVKKIVFHSHANDVEGKHKKARRVFHRICARIISGIPAIHIATSREAAAWMFPKDKPQDTIILDNGIEYERFRFNESVRGKVRKKIGLEDELLLGFIGRFVYQKNPFYLLDIMKAIQNEIPKAKLLCIGEGFLKDEFIQQAIHENLIDKVTVLDGTDYVEEYYQAMDQVLMPSQFEGFGLVAVEAQISGTPVLASEHVPTITKISDLITYLPIGKENIDQWAAEIKKQADHHKQDTFEDLDRRYDISGIVQKLSDIYRNC